MVSRGPCVVFCGSCVVGCGSCVVGRASKILHVYTSYIHTLMLFQMPSRKSGTPNDFEGIVPKMVR